MDNFDAVALTFTPHPHKKHPTSPILLNIYPPLRLLDTAGDTLYCVPESRG